MSKFYKKIIRLEIFLALLMVLLLLVVEFWPASSGKLISPLSFSSQPPETIGELESLGDYSFENLAKRQFKGSQIEIDRLIKTEESHEAYLFFYLSNNKRVSGQLNIPRKGDGLPVLIMIRGYADKEVYFTGLGTRKAADFFAENGFVTLAPDFLGFGQSDPESSDILLNRFRRPETILNLLASVKNLNSLFEKENFETRVDPKKVFIWSHSNGGQIALSVLEITQESIPTTFWAPVTEAFPESVLQYASEFDDYGKLVIASIEAFVKDYDPVEYSIVHYLGKIRAPVQVHQGSQDPYVDLESSNRFVKELEELDKNVTYYVYEGDDHNFKSNWDRVIRSDLEFFEQFR